MRLKKSHFHFIGIGGIGMCGLAELLANMGAKVSGSDLAENAQIEKLRSLGVKIYNGHDASNVGDADVVVYSSAVPFDNPEIAHARAKKIPLIPRAEALAEMMRLKRGIAVAGTHGKTTTTSLVASVFLQADISPTIFVGGRFELIKSTALLGQGEWLIAEADESDGSFEKLSPEIAIITNVDSDHLDYHKTFENLQNAFYEFALKVPFYGMCIVCGDDPLVRSLFAQFPKRILFYGFEKHNDVVIEGSHGEYTLYKQGNKIGNFKLPIPGRHNALNAAAAMITGLEAGFSFDFCRQGLLQFAGVDRRFQFKDEVAGIKVYDDYGHHPTEVRAVLSAFREKFPDNRLVVLFQPHRYSRTQHCWHDFINCFSEANELFLTDIYPAGEVPIAGISSERLCQEIKSASCHYLPRNQELVAKLKSHLKPGDVFVTLGAGDGWKIGLELLSELKSK